MSTVINVKAPKVGKEFKGEYDFGATLDEAVAKFGGEVVLSGFISDATVSAQAIVRGALVRGKSEDEADAILQAWKPGVARARSTVDPMAALIESFAKKTPEEKAEFLKKLASMAGASEE